MKAYLKCENMENHKTLDLKIEGQEWDVAASYDELLEFKENEDIKDYDIMSKERLYAWLKEYGITLYDDSRQWLEDLKNVKWKILGWTEVAEDEARMFGF
ncbi:hypothetical protein MFLO_15708 [Listeria floridensis FSL S10-1187]|uniref:Phage protein n=1 Tax=Listeria floridensis FSL S10-1187 TaxID=1265817 RepID=A0ABN0RBM7_9LIST|nr:hypothetical protein [Listeria floridensis]EUJ24247.1 hypothetical protein MFLO_15708 [Listeria floridensis FSL S10-1187]